MRVALVGWESDDAISSALAGLATDLVVFTRWFPDLPRREDRGGWIKLRCPHQIGGGPAAEAGAFREALLARVSDLDAGYPEALGSGTSSRRAGGIDVVHALDPMARPAAEALAARQPGSLRVAAIGLADVLPTGDDIPAAADHPADRLVCDHPWIADRWRAATGHAATLVPTQGMAEPSPVRPSAAAAHEGPLVALWITREAELDPAAVARALAEARAELPGLSAAVLGCGLSAQALKRRLAEHRLLVRGAEGPCDVSPGAWAGWLAAADVVGLVSHDLAEEPAAWAAWSFGTPVVGLTCARPSALAERLREAITVRGRYEEDVKAGAALARRRLAPAAVAAGWLGVYLDTLGQRADAGAASSATEAPAALPLVRGGRSRLALVALGPRELYASWHVRPDDRATAIQWLGHDAVRAAVALRISDVTDIHFHGSEAHHVWDIELGHGESFRSIGLASPGRSVIASLGLKSPRGYFHPLAHAGPTHLPAEAEAPNPPTRRLQVLPRRSFRPAR